MRHEPNDVVLAYYFKKKAYGFSSLSLAPEQKNSLSIKKKKQKRFWNFSCGSVHISLSQTRACGTRTPGLCKNHPDSLSHTVGLVAVLLDVKTVLVRIVVGFTRSDKAAPDCVSGSPAT